MKTIFLNARGSEAPEEVLRRSSNGARRFSLDVTDFASVPTSPFSYWVPSSLRSIFETVAPVKTAARQAWSGATTMDDFRHARAWFELPAMSNRSDWPLFSKGGSFQRFYLPIYLCVDWRCDGLQMKSRISYLRESRGHGPQWTAVLNGYKKYFQPGIYWSRRSQRGMSTRILPPGAVFSDKSPTLVAGPREDPLALLGVLNSSTFQYLVSMQMAFGSYEVGVINRTPLPSLANERGDSLSIATRRAWSLARAADTANEVSHSFILPAVLRAERDTLSTASEGWKVEVNAIREQLDSTQFEIDALCFALYQVSDPDRKLITDGPSALESEFGDDESAGEEPDESCSLAVLDQTSLAEGLVSWAVGVGVGRFDVRLATGERGWPEEPDPLDQLPACSPGMLTGVGGLSTSPPVGYAVSVSPMLVDDPGHPLDVTGRVRAVFDAVFGVNADEWWSDVGEALGGDVDSWLAKGFFAYHLKAYSQSRRKAPVLWPIGTESGSYLVWLYAHEVSADSLFQVLHDVVEPKLGVEERQLTRLRQDAGVNPSLSQRKAIDAQERFVGELRQLREELESTAPLWAPDLTDGIVVVLAPLWRLFAHHRPWSNELKKHWARLAKGDYDWAQLAMYLWPERVIRKCVADRSLAIAHGVEDIFWAQDSDDDGKWCPRAKPTIPIEQLIAQHHNPAAAAALEREST
jgi:hypothetical protein